MPAQKLNGLGSCKPKVVKRQLGFDAREALPDPRVSRLKSPYLKRGVHLQRLELVKKGGTAKIDLSPLLGAGGFLFGAIKCIIQV